jgi:hypothetical protein
MNAEFSATRADGYVVLVRTVECVVCCKRKRAACEICKGTGLRRVEHTLTRAAALQLGQQLLEASDEHQTRESSGVRG